jgi:hypothetical protein
MNEPFFLVIALYYSETQYPFYEQLKLFILIFNPSILVFKKCRQFFNSRLIKEKQEQAKQNAVGR